MPKRNAPVKPLKTRTSAPASLPVTRLLSGTAASPVNLAKPLPIVPFNDAAPVERLIEYSPVSPVALFRSEANPVVLAAGMSKPTSPAADSVTPRAWEFITAPPLGEGDWL